MRKSLIFLSLIYIIISLTACKRRGDEFVVRQAQKDSLCFVFSQIIDSDSTSNADRRIAAIMEKFHQTKNSRGKNPSLKRLKASVARKYACKGDSVRALRYLRSAMKDTVLTKFDVMKSIDAKGKNVANILIAKGDYVNATKTYYANLETCDSMAITINKYLDAGIDHAETVIIGLVLFILVIVIIGIAVYQYEKYTEEQYRNEEEYFSVTTSMQDSIDSYQQMLTELQATQTDNRRETDMLRRQIDNIQSRLMERMQTGRELYNSLLQGNRMPHDLKDADSYIIDYVMLFLPDKYKQWQQMYEKLTPRAYTYLILNDMGHSDSAIQEILSVSASSVRSIKSRLNSRRIQPS